MEKKYQVFVSSTYQDLLAERQEVMQALLELDCIPVGMELFPAADDDQWTLIKDLIDDCDYYVLIVGGRYGSTNKDGVSYTQMEYEYALQKEIPIISFLPKHPEKIEAGKTEQDPELKKQLASFKDLVQEKMCRYWSDPVDLGSQVSRSLVKLIKSKPRPGWIKADQLPSENATQEILELRKKVQELEKQKTEAPKGTDDLMQGEDKFDIHFSYEVWTFSWEHKNGQIELTWNEIFYLLSPLMVDEAQEFELKSSINGLILDKMREEELKDIRKGDFRKPQISDTDFQTIKVQLRALGLIEKNDKKRSIKDTATYWTLTAYGDSVMIRLRALKK